MKNKTIIATLIILPTILLSGCYTTTYPDSYYTTSYSPSYYNYGWGGGGWYGHGNNWNRTSWGHGRNWGHAGQGWGHSGGGWGHGSGFHGGHGGHR